MLSVGLLPLYTSTTGLINIGSLRVWGHAVAQLVDALRYKPEGRVSLGFLIDIILPAALWPWDRPSLQQK
jgi:hypothetical protein